MLDRVLDLIRAVACEELIPRFRRLGSSDMHEKSPGEVVTVADVAAEAALTHGLLRLMPGSIVIGEEACHADPSLISLINNREHTWVVDALDGTRHFAAGEESWGVMVALLQQGQVDAAWIHLPLTDHSAWGRRGERVLVDGTPVTIPEPPPMDQMRGALLTRFLPSELRITVESYRALERTDALHHCAARRYLDLLTGDEHFALYYRTLPWDHAPGAFLAQQAGAAVHRFDGREYNPGDGGSGLLVAANEEIWRRLHDRLLPQQPGAGS